MSSTAAFKVGGYIKTYCSRCCLELGHTIVAMMSGSPARVRCDTCRSERNYRAPKTTREILTRRESRPKVSASLEDVYDRRIKELAHQNAKPYKLDGVFEVNDLVDHPTFGRGIVTKVIFPDRLELMFRDATKVLANKPKPPSPSDQAK